MPNPQATSERYGMTAPKDVWCVLCGQAHPFHAPCDPKRVMQLRRQATFVRRLATQQRKVTTDNG